MTKDSELTYSEYIKRKARYLSMHADLISILGDKPQVAFFALYAANLENL